MDIPQALGLVAGGGLSSGTAVVLLARLLAASWLRELQSKFDAIDKRFASISEAQAEAAQEHEREKRDVNAQQVELFREMRRLSGQVAYLNGQLAARGLVQPKPAAPEQD